MTSLRLVTVLTLGLAALVSATASGAELAVGDTAPPFELQGSDGRRYALVDLLGSGGFDGIVLAWFPKAFTGG